VLHRAVTAPSSPCYPPPSPLSCACRLETSSKACRRRGRHTEPRRPATCPPARFAAGRRLGAGEPGWLPVARCGKGQRPAPLWARTCVPEAVPRPGMSPSAAAPAAARCQRWKGGKCVCVCWRGGARGSVVGRRVSGTTGRRVLGAGRWALRVRRPAAPPPSGHVVPWPLHCATATLASAGLASEGSGASTTNAVVGTDGSSTGCAGSVDASAPVSRFRHARQSARAWG